VNITILIGTPLFSNKPIEVFLMTPHVKSPSLLGVGNDLVSTLAKKFVASCAGAGRF